MTPQRKRAGRPQGTPSQVLPVRIPIDLIQRLDRYLDLAETRTGLRSNRTEALRQALAYWLDAKEQALKADRPQSMAQTRANG
jgi:Arc/MetJ-type ribon-helix-helix transcriptional regulator